MCLDLSRIEIRATISRIYATRTAQRARGGEQKHVLVGGGAWAWAGAHSASRGRAGAGVGLCRQDTSWGCESPAAESKRTLRAPALCARVFAPPPPLFPLSRPELQGGCGGAPGCGKRSTPSGAASRLDPTGRGGADGFRRGGPQKEARRARARARGARARAAIEASGCGQRAWCVSLGAVFHVRRSKHAGTLARDAVTGAATPARLQARARASARAPRDACA